MLNSIATFRANIVQARNLTDLFDYLSHNVQAPFPYEDLLRFQIVYSVSAFDKLIHDLVRIGMVAIFAGTRAPTPKYHNEQISLAVHGTLTGATVPPKEILFEKEVVRKLAIVAYQDPTKVADGLSYIWNEMNKWDKIAARMGISSEAARKKLKLISVRRNAIVHEADMDPLTNAKAPISRDECTDVTDFLLDCGSAIGALVI